MSYKPAAARYRSSAMCPLMQVAPSRRRRLSMYVGVAAIVVVTLLLIVLSFMFSYDPKALVKG